ncbi:uric acid degradation bifunctional protein TTL-like isoform X1 [Trifolium pratense]|uniref:uric acid degradation bifunctional protein TTL-like isoform X1 n=1 Tax=Trifolium pratense TaxID=57577 RepID=UPI001E692F36|nr:uric acid degradation bifunctional protein TTL-like isoform X1 [Trifolium pratense]
MEAVGLGLDENDYLSCCGSTKWAKEMASNSPFPNYHRALSVSKQIWLNKLDINSWLQAFSAHPSIGQTNAPSHASQTSAQWSRGEQSTALATATDSKLQELAEWNARYMEKFGFVFLIFASGISIDAILAEIKKRYTNRPIVELEIASQEQMKITEIRLTKLFTSKKNISSTTDRNTTVARNAEEVRVNVIGGHVTAAPDTLSGTSIRNSSRTRPPITTHVLDISRGYPASGIEVILEIWKGNQPRPPFGTTNSPGWVFKGSSKTDSDGRSGQLIDIVDDAEPGIYRLSFNTGKYNPNGFFPYVSVVFEIFESQKKEHFHVPLLLSPFSFSTYRGS